MATPTAFTSDMLREIVRDMDKLADGAGYGASPMKSLLVSRGARERMMAEFRAAAPVSTGDQLVSGFTQTFMGIPIEAVDIPPEEVLDWSGCRSPSRAKRRHAQGKPQRVKATYRDRAFLVDRRALMGLGRDLDRMMVQAFFDESK